MAGAFEFRVQGVQSVRPARGLFVTGTDTGVGKTLVAGAIARNLRSAGLRVGVFKPVATGCSPAGLGGELVSQDGAFLAWCADSPQPHHLVAPQRFRAALAPNVAAQREHRTVDLAAVADAYDRIAAESDVMIVEGVGGLLCPLTDDFWVIHLAKLLGLPLLVVARAGLGTINHTLLTLHAARSAGLEPVGAVLSRYQIEPATAQSLQRGEERHPHSGRPHEDADLAMFTNPQQIADRGQVRVLALVPDDPASSVEDVRLGADVRFAIDQVNWAKLIG